MFAAVGFLVMAQPNSTRLQGGESADPVWELMKDIKAASMEISLSEGPQAQTRVWGLFSAQVNDKNRCIN